MLTEASGNTGAIQTLGSAKSQACLREIIPREKPQAANAAQRQRGFARSAI
jgi:hypothetical protein